MEKWKHLKKYQAEIKRKARLIHVLQLERKGIYDEGPSS